MIQCNWILTWWYNWSTGDWHQTEKTDTCLEDLKQGATDREIGMPFFLDNTECSMEFSWGNRKPVSRTYLNRLRVESIAFQIARTAKIKSDHSSKPKYTAIKSISNISGCVSNSIRMTPTFLSNMDHFQSNGLKISTAHHGTKCFFISNHFKTLKHHKSKSTSNMDVLQSVSWPSIWHHHFLSFQRHRIVIVPLVALQSKLLVECLVQGHHHQSDLGLAMANRISPFRGTTSNCNRKNIKNQPKTEENKQQPKKHQTHI